MSWLTEDGLRSALAYLRASDAGDDEALEVLTEHSDLLVLVEHLAWVARALTTRPAQPSAESTIDALFAVVEQVYSRGVREP